MREQRGGESVLVAGMLVLLAVVFLGGGAALWLWQSSTRAREMALAARAQAQKQEAQALLAKMKMQTFESIDEAEKTRTVARQTVNAAASDTETIAAIKQVLFDQQTAWNAGDIDRFMEGYWKSDELSFSSGGSTKRSWQTTIEHYKKRYDTPERMGTLTFSELEVHLLADDAAFVLGRWDLKDLAGGNFTVIFRRFDEGWRIIHDHTSQTP